MKYRIKQVDKDIFIAQHRNSFFDVWKSIDNKKNYTWRYNEDYCYNKTYEEALTVIENHKQCVKEQNKYPKYYKI